MGFIIKKSCKIGKIGKMIHKHHLAISMDFVYFLMILLLDLLAS